MLFNSIEYFIFFPLIILLYFLLKGKFIIKGWMIILAASLYFYMSLKPEYVLLIILSAIVNYFAAINIDKSSARVRKIILALAIIYNIGILFAFKYFNFFNTTISDALKSISIPFDPVVLSILLPIGISFYTFQALGYVIDVYRKKTPAQKHFGIVFTYIAFFPTVLAGPIERAKNLMPQISKTVNFSWSSAEDGVKLILWGLFKKVVIADRLAIVVNTVYANPFDYTGAPLILATIFFAFQIYIDFSAYSDIAIGSARILGININENFKRPYLSLSFSEFWHRWHISLSSWFRDYLYIPLGGSRVSQPRWCLNILIVFIISGLWHGANITFAIWGALHGIYLILEKIFKDLFFVKENKDIKPRSLLTNKITNLMSIIIVFILTAIAWVFFRAADINQAIYILKNMFLGLGADLSYTRLGGIGGYMGLAVAFGLILVLILFEILQEKGFLSKAGAKIPLWARTIIYIIVINAIIFLGVSGEQFIYFSF